MKIFEICKLVQIKKVYNYSSTDKTFIKNMPALNGNEWAGNLDYAIWKWGDRVKIDALKRVIANKLVNIQGTNCAFCGMKLKVTSSGQIEHIAPKGPNRFPEYMFDKNNLVIACSLCNGFEKKERKDFSNTIGKNRGRNYKNEPFNIVHPKLDDPKDHYNLGVNEDKVVISHKTLKGQKSIAMLKLDDEPHTTERFKMLMMNTYKSNPKFKKLADEIFMNDN